MNLAHGNVVGKRKDRRVGDAELLIPGGPHGFPWVLLSVTKGKNYQWKFSSQYIGSLDA